MEDDVGVGDAAVGEIGGRVRQLAAKAAEQRAAGVVLGLPFRGADPAVAVGGAAVLEVKGVQHAVADEPVRAGHVELRVGAVAIQRAVELARQFAGDFQNRRVTLHRDRPAVAHSARIGLSCCIANSLMLSLHRKDMAYRRRPARSSKIFTVSKLDHITRSMTKKTGLSAKRRSADRPGGACARRQGEARAARRGRGHALSPRRAARRVAAGGRAGAGARGARGADAARGGARGRRVACGADASFRRSHRPRQRARRHRLSPVQRGDGGGLRARDAVSDEGAGAGEGLCWCYLSSPGAALRSQNACFC